MGIFDKVKDIVGKGDDEAAAGGLTDKIGDLAGKLPENTDDKVEDLAGKLPGGAGDKAADAVDSVFDKIPGQAD